VQKMGCPPRDKLSFIPNQSALQRILTYERHPAPDFASFFPRSANPAAIDLLKQMLAFHPDDRITVIEAMKHPYLAAFHGQMAEPEVPSLFNFNFEQRDGRDVHLSKGTGNIATTPPLSLSLPTHTHTLSHTPDIPLTPLGSRRTSAHVR